MSRNWSIHALALVLVLPGTQGAASQRVAEESRSPDVNNVGILNAAFVCTQGVYNSELMAPFDVLQHSVFRDSLNFIRPFIVTEDGAPFTSFEGIQLQPDYSFESVPRIDILVIPSTENSMGNDLQNVALVDFLRQKIPGARWVMSLCDGAFPLAASGALDGRVATTFPADRQAFAARFPKVQVRNDVRFVVDGKFITAVGGAPSYEPAFYLVETLYSRQHAERSAAGLVFDWNLDTVPHLVVGSSTTRSLALASFDWLQGDWVRQTRRGEVMESWRRVSVGTLEGVTTLSQNGETRETEALRLERLGEGVFYIAKPLENPLPTGFRLIDSSADRFVFENLEHDFPQRIIYTRVSDTELLVRIEGKAEAEGSGRDFRFVKR